MMPCPGIGTSTLAGVRFVPSLVLPGQACVVHSLECIPYNHEFGLRSYLLFTALCPPPRYLLGAHLGWYLAMR